MVIQVKPFMRCIKIIFNLYMQAVYEIYKYIKHM